MDSNRAVFKAIEGYLTKAAKEALSQAEASGMKRDLAIAFMEATCSEKEIYNLEEES